MWSTLDEGDFISSFARDLLFFCTFQLFEGPIQYKQSQISTDAMDSLAAVKINYRCFWISRKIDK